MKKTITLNRIRLSLKRISFFEKLLIISIAIISITSYLFMYVNALELSEGKINVKQNGDVIFQLGPEALKQDGVYDFTFDKGIGYLEVKDKRVRILPMDRSICPKAICSETGWIKNSLKAIVCLPNKLVVSIESYDMSGIDEMAF